MKDKIPVLIFGGSGTVGKPLIRRLTQADYIVTVASRNIHRTSHKLVTQGPPGYIKLEECQLFDEEKIRKLIKKNSIIINLVGILHGTNSDFENIHIKFPILLAKISKEYNIEQFIHLSALGIENATDSIYAKSKLEGENNIKKIFQKVTVLKPSVVYSVDDNFTCKFMSLLGKIPFVFPLYYKGKTLFRPIFIQDLIEIIFNIIYQEKKSLTIECIGSEEISLKNILKKLLKLIGKQRMLVPMPLSLAKIVANFFELFPNPLITSDQLKLLRYSNIPSKKFKTNFDLGMPSNANFEQEVKKWSWMFSERGEYSKEKYKDDT